MKQFQLVDYKYHYLLQIKTKNSLKTNNNDIENVIENIHDLRENILYILSFEKVVREDKSENNKLIGKAHLSPKAKFTKRDIAHTLKLWTY